jgi:serpin B
LAACGTGTDGAGEGADVSSVGLNEQPRVEPDPSSDPNLAGHPLLAFGSDLFAAVAAAAGSDENVIVSPASVGIALAMLEPGAVGDARVQLRELLRIENPEAFHASMNALEQSLEARVAQAFNEDDKPGEVIVRVVNAAYLQQGYPFQRTYLDTIGAHYGPVLNAVDFESDPDAVAHHINQFVAEATHDRIRDLVGEGVLRSETVLALVNALYLKASWLQVFDGAMTAEEPFTRLDGAELTVSMMRGFSDSSARGDGWVAATKAYVGGLSAQFILPDDGRFEAVAADVASVVAAFEQNRTSGAPLALPRFTARFGAEISDSLKALGLKAPYERGNLLGIADDRRLVLDRAIHQTFVAMDEQGTEAAAATVLTGVAVSGPPSPPVPVILDRPFLFRIYDQHTGVTLFLGRILEPNA